MKNLRGRRAWTRLGIALASVVVVAAVATGLILARGDRLAAVASPASAGGSSAPSLEGTDPVTGKRVSLASYRGKPVVINIWASWCPGCIAEADDLRRFAREHPEAQVLGIDFQDTKGGAKEFYRRTGWKHPSIFDPSGALAAKLGLQGLPMTLFLNERHEIVTQIVGETDLAGFEDGLRQATAA